MTILLMQPSQKPFRVKRTQSPSKFTFMHLRKGRARGVFVFFPWGGGQKQNQSQGGENQVKGQQNNMRCHPLFPTESGVSSHT
ncbi:hypothetical protein AMTRI_Chr02g255420 [Amborella trichopoda]